MKIAYLAFLPLLSLTGCSDPYENVEIDWPNIQQQSTELRRAGRCTASALPPRKGTHLCGGAATTLYAITTRDLVKKTNQIRVSVSFGSKCKDHELEAQQIESNLRGARRRLTDHPAALIRPLGIKVSAQAAPSPDESEAAESAMGSAGRLWFRNQEIAEQKAAEKQRALTAARQRANASKRRKDQAKRQLEAAKASAATTKDFAAEVEKTTTQLSMRVATAIKEPKSRAATAIDDAKKLLPLIVEAAESAKRWSAGTAAGAKQVVAWSVKAGKNAGSKATEATEATEASKATRRFAAEAAKEARHRAEQILERSERRAVAAATAATRNSTKAAEAARAAEAAENQIAEAVDATRQPLAAATETAEQRAADAIKAAEAAVRPWIAFAQAAEVASQKTAEAVRAAEEAEQPSSAALNDANQEAKQAVAASLAAQTLAQKADEAAEMARREALESAKAAERRTTELAAKARRVASDAANDARRELDKVAQVANSAKQLADQEAALSKRMTDYTAFEKGCNELISLTMEFADLYESARDLDSALNAKPRMKEIKVELTRCREMIVKNGLPESEKIPVFVQKSFENYFVVGKKAVRVDRYGPPTALGKAFDAVTDRMVLCRRRLGQFLPDGSGKVDPGGKIRNALRETYPGPCLGIPLSSREDS